MGDGGWIKDKGIKLSTNCFSLSNVKLLIFIIDIKYNMITATRRTDSSNQYNIYVYIPNKNLHILVPIVLPYMHPYFLYKLNMLKPNLAS